MRDDTNLKKKDNRKEKKSLLAALVREAEESDLATAAGPAGAAVPCTRRIESLG